MKRCIQHHSYLREIKVSMTTALTMLTGYITDKRKSISHLENSVPDFFAMLLIN